MAYIDGFLVPVLPGKRDAYVEMARAMVPLFQEFGATRVVECGQDDLKPGKTNDFHTAVIAEPGEEVFFSWIEWPSKEVRDAGWAKMMEDERMKQMPSDLPFAGARMIYGGFAPLVDERV